MPCARALACTRAGLWVVHVVAVTYVTVCASVAVAAGLAGPWAPPALVDCCVSFSMLAACLLGSYLFNICINNDEEITN
jgi:hypothetical protein